MEEYQKRRRSSGKRKSTSTAEIKYGNGESMEPEHVSKKITQVPSPTCNGNSGIPAAETAAVARNIPSKEVAIAAVDDDTCKFQREDHDPIIIDLSDDAPDVEDAGEANNNNNNNNNNTGTGLVAGAEQIIINSHEDDQYSPMGISFNCSGILVGTSGPGAVLNELSDPISTGRTDENRNDEAQSFSEELTRDQAQPLTEETEIEMFPNLLFLENWTNGCELLFN
ncbi:hypothetical protein CJ030_MR4G029101 [Morella rubra]|uniref:Uncharacterized protein n=1 Tax=Morella rubra TaxID=262757 RepID=A0A6A1VVU8_9ROSI|nr:hypothetical protein CJ030_MR4G029101 [Morella rubra]